MFNLDTEISQWRHEMTAAGIPAGKVLDELESHLRDDVDQAAKAGATLEAAFGAAVAKLGPPPALRREFEAGAPETVATLLRRPIPVFPTDMRRLAFAALFFGPSLMMGAIQNLMINRVVFAPDHLAKQHYLPTFGLFLALFFLYGVLGLTSAIGYLWKPSYRFARPLAAFWVFLGWSLCSILLAVFGGRGFPVAWAWPFSISSLLLIVVAVVVYDFWSKALRGDFRKTDESRDTELHLPV